MEKQIKDYLHYYLKSDLLCKVKRKNDKKYHIGKLCEVTYKSNHGDWASFWFDDVITVTSQTWETSSANNHWFFFGEDSITPLLRPLSSMTEEECQECGNLVYDFSDDNSGLGLNEHSWEQFTTLILTEQFDWLLKRGFDLFGLIEEGLAIDKTTINHHQ